MKVLLAQANARAGGGAEYFCERLSQVLDRMNIEVDHLDSAGHVPVAGALRPLAFGPTGRSLLDWARVCRHARNLSARYDAVILGYGEGPAMVRPTLHIRHAPSLFGTRPVLLHALGSDRPGLRAPYHAACRAIAGPVGRPTVALANSAWTRDSAQRHDRLGEAGVLYPPLPPLPPMTGVERDPFGIVMLGRIVPNKRHLEGAAIVADLRAAGFPATLTVIGRPVGRQGQRIVRALSAMPFVRLELAAPEDRKRALLWAARFGLHLYRSEHFGIAVAEMIEAGVIPIVHDAGGVTELVTPRALRTRTAHQATETLIRLLRHPELLPGLGTSLSASPALLAARAFDRHARAAMQRFLGGAKDDGH